MSDSTNTEQPNLIIGTAGHIDHGKSSLVQALTGTDPDRLAEEKRRGITIELGFAQLKLPSGRALGVVDVPGHERFVRHMVAGATGIDLALIVIAADDGIMPQTVEHLAVLELLGVRDAVVALTKIDLVDDEWRSFIADDVSARLSGTPFENAPIVGVSSRTGEGLDELRAAIDKVAARAHHTKDNGPARMPVDRVFTVKGFGTVITGSLWSGSLSEGDELVVLPGNKSTRVRSVQMHGTSVEKAPAGNRVAASLAGLSCDDVRPGDFVCAPAAAAVSDRFDAEFAYLDPFSFGKPLKSGSRVHVAHGTREVIGRVLLMDGATEIASGQRTLAQIRLEEPLPLAYRDRFIVRSYSPTHVIGGGTVLAAHPRRRTNLKPEELSMLSALESGDADAAIGAHLELAELPETAEDIANACGLEQRIVDDCLARLEAELGVASLGDSPRYFARAALVQKLMSALDRALLEFHSANPRAIGLSKEELRRAVSSRASSSCFDAIVAEALRRGVIVQSGAELSHPKASAGARKIEAEAADTIAAALAEAGSTPPDLGTVAADAGIDLSVARKAAGKLVADGRAVRVEGDRYYDAEVIARFKAAMRDLLEKQGRATAAELKEAMGTTRKYAMPLLEYFDSIGFTRRNDDARTLGPAASREE